MDTIKQILRRVDADPQFAGAFASVMALWIFCGIMFFIVGWIGSGGKRQRQVMAMASLLFPVTFAVAPVIWAVAICVGVGKGIIWLVETAAGETE